MGKLVVVKGSGKSEGWIKGASVRLSAVHTYHAGKAIGPGIKSAKSCCAGKSKKS